MCYADISNDEFLARDLTERLRQTVGDLPTARRNLILLMVASGLTEASAYDLAVAEQPEHTALLILAAAEIDRHAARQRRRAANPEMG